MGTPGVELVDQVIERGDTERPTGWRARTAVAVLVRSLLDMDQWQPRKILSAAAVVAGIGVLTVASWWIGLAAAFLTLLAIVRPVLTGLAHGRVWEVRSPGVPARGRATAWAVVVPHPMDQRTWRLDITLHPLSPARPGWADALVTRVNEAADVFDVSVQSSDPQDEPVLIWHGYLPAETLLSPRTVLQRFPPAREQADQTAADLRALRDLVAENRSDLLPLHRLADRILADADPILGRPQSGWEEVVLRRTGALWELARSSAVVFDGYIEFLSLARLDPSSFPEGHAGLESRLDRIGEVLMRSAVALRTAIRIATVQFLARGGEPLQWAEGLAMLEVEALSLSGLVGAARRGPTITLAVLDPEVQRHVEAAARSVRRHTTSLRRRRLFDTGGLVWWAGAIAGDALELCGLRRGRLLLRRSVRKLKANELRHLVVIPRSQRVGRKPLDDDPIERWATLGSVTRLGQAPTKALADLSSTRSQRVGMSRGAEGLRQKRLQAAVRALIANNLLLLLAGIAVWLFVVALENPAAALLGPSAALARALRLDLPAPIERIGSDVRFEFAIPISTDLVWETTLGLLAVVITGAVAVAVATPREASTRLWAQDRAWQLLIVVVGYGASTAALVLAIAPLPSWSVLEPNDRAEALAALAFAVLASSAATSTSALQSRLDAWQRQRRSLTAALRLRRANDRLGPPPRYVELVVRAVACFAICLLPLMLLLVAMAILTGDSVRELWSFAADVIAINLPPMLLVTALLVIKWVNDWGLVGRVADAIFFVLAVALVLYLALAAVAASTLEEGSAGWVLGFLLLLFVLHPVVLLLVALVRARALANQPRAWTGPATFALHLALRIGRWNSRRH